MQMIPSGLLTFTNFVSVFDYNIFVNSTSTTSFKSLETPVLRVGVFKSNENFLPNLPPFFASLLDHQEFSLDKLVPNTTLSFTLP